MTNYRPTDHKMNWQPKGAACGLDLGRLVHGIFETQSDQVTGVGDSRLIRQ